MPVALRPTLSYIFILICVQASSGWLWAQSFRFPQPRYITDREGLPQAFVPSILQDNQGFIWAATRDGLCRYDGYRFKVFQPDPDGRPSLSFAGLNQIVLDRHNRIWIVSERGDIDIFDPRSETFTNFSRQAAFRRLVKPGTSYVLRIDQKDRLWLTASDSGVICWDTPKKRGRWFRHQPQQAKSLSSNLVYDVSEGKDGTIWLATAKGLDRFEEATQSFAHLRHQVGVARSLPEDSIAHVRVRPTGELLLLSRRYLTLLEPRTGQLRSYRLPELGSEWYGNSIAFDQQGTVYFDQNNLLFQFADQQGVQVVARWNQLTDGCNSLFIDRTNVLWLGTNGSGIRTYDLQPNPFQKRPYHQNFYQDLLTNDTLGLPPVSPVALARLKGLSSYNLRYVFDPAGRFWFNVGTSDLYRLDRKTGQTEHFPLPITFHWEAPYIPCPMATDPQGRVWAIYGGTAFWFEEKNKRWKPFLYADMVRPDEKITEAVFDQQALWLASQLGGLYRVDRQNGTVRQFINRPDDATSLSSNSLYCLSADPADANRLWVGTFGGGLCLFDKRTGQFRRFTQGSGLPNNVVYTAIPDPSGYLWMGTNKGLCRMNRRTFETQTFTRNDGIMADEFNRNHYVAFPEGKILMGGLEGFTLFNSRRIGQDAFAPVVELTELEVNDRIIQPNLPGPNGVDTTSSANRSLLGVLPIQATRQLTLAHDQNYVTVHFAALQFNQPNRNRYRYKLEGLEKTWKETDRPEAIYTNLPPGDYGLVINAANTSGRWSPHVRRLAITIQPPFWATWWAIGLYCLAGLSLAWGLLQLYLNRIRLKQAIQLRQQETDQLRAVNVMKTNFFTNITHEFRTPLTLILGPTEQMIRETTEPRNRQRLTTIEQNAQQLLRLMNQLMELSKLEAHVMPVNTSRGNLTESVRQWLVPFSDQAGALGLSLQFHSGVSGEYWFDAEKLERILYNLTANALKFTQNGTVTVSLETASDQIQLTVADTGLGISPEHLPHIFDRFYRITESSATPGTGIGLALVQELVQLQGGHISVRSQPNRGTTFTILMPYQPVAWPGETPEASAERLAETEADTRAGGEESGEPRLLIVEDHDALARFIADSLPPHYRIHRAIDGSDGLQKALECVPDLILSDVMMPGMDGLTLCHHLKADVRTSHIPVILLTAKATVEHRLAGLTQGADDYLTKPFQVAELQLRIRNQLMSRQRQREWVRVSLMNPDFVPAEPATAPLDPFLVNLYNLLDTHLSDPEFGVEQMMVALGLSRTNLFRKVKALTGLSANDLLRNYRLKRAAQLLRAGETVNQTAYQVGFNSPAYFSKCFREYYQLTPREFASQSSQEPR
ncbi:ATP-binding protein [Larkinella insperata]|uniref:histidine kinase n=1 Tax=Larkinella insperata TaxID=332158 RepID=A0ABW3QKW7_9BACT